MPQHQESTSVRRFHDLIPFRVREVLLVSSPYDSFVLQEDGHLTERMYFEYKEISLSSSPRFTHVTNSEAAIRLLRERRFDLILAMTSLAGMDINAFGRRVKELRPGRPVVLLAIDRNEVSRLRDVIDPKAIDDFFLWSGDIQILLAVIKCVEDRHNVDHDIRSGNVRVIIMIEDSPQYYASFLGVLYEELMRQSLSLYSEGLNDLYRLMYMRSRPKVLHARSYEEGMELFRKYRRNVLAVISDIAVPRNGELDLRAGLDFARNARRYDPALPLLLQSAQADNREKAVQLGAAFLDKNSKNLLSEVSDFLARRLGFGDFIFRTPDGEEYDRARDLRELEQKLAIVPEDVFDYHARHNHISIWLTARSEFRLAEELRPKKVTDFPTVEECRQHIVQSLREARKRIHRGIISDFDSGHFELEQFNRIGKGYLGGKARGIAFLYQILADTDPSSFQGLPVSVPQTIVVTTDEFDRFIEENKLRDFAFTCEDDASINRRFLEAQLSEELMEKLELIIERIPGPLAVRSSSLLEDSMHQPFAGIYSTLMIPNHGPNIRDRVRDLRSAIKLVFASTFLENAKSYLAATGNRIEEEKMAVIIQKVVGRQHGRRYYPTFSGVAQSHNYYPIGPQKAEEGIVHVALGLGRLVVDGGLALRFSPKHPQSIPHLARPKSFLESTQRGFFALDMDRQCCLIGEDLYDTLQYYDLKAAEDDGALHLLASVYSHSEERIRDDLSLPGPRVITFNNILRYRAIPLPQALEKVLELTREGLGGPVEVEFACELGDWGKRVRRGEEKQEPELHLLQVRPLVSRSITTEFSSVRFTREEVLCSSRGGLGHGLSREICDVVYVRGDHWDSSKNKIIAREVGMLNSQLEGESRPYILIGPGRWGSGDPWLGIPVKWSQISSARVIIEASPSGYNVDPSQGTHFFHNITAHGVGYLTLPPGVEKANQDSEYYLDWEWLGQQVANGETHHLRHLRFSEPMTVMLDGRDGHAVISKPGC